MEAFLEWAIAHDAHLLPSLEVRDGPRGRGLFARSAIRAGVRLCRVPDALRLDPPPSLASSCGSLLALSIRLLHETHVASPPSPYASLLAASTPPRLPLLWPPHECEHLAGTSLLPPGLSPSAAAAAVAAAATRAFDDDVTPRLAAVDAAYLPPQLATRAALSTALAWVISRSVRGTVNYEAQAASVWPYLRADGPPDRADGPFLLPLFDLVNHASREEERSTVLRRAAEGGAFELYAERDIAAGEEVLQSYGPLGAAELLRSYGFVEESPHSSLSATHEELIDALVAISPRRGDRRAKARAKAEERMDALKRAERLPVLFQIGAQEISSHLLTAAQVLVMSDEEYEEWLEVGISLGEEFLDEESLSAVQSCLLNLADGCARRHHAALPAGDKEEADSAAGLCAALRKEEKRVLLAFKKAVLMLQPGCNEGDEEGEGEGEVEEDEEGEGDGDGDGEAEEPNAVEERTVVGDGGVTGEREGEEGRRPSKLAKREAYAA
ncbi:hypothetical protein AB1Y20_013597 [Prymnesium parvum]|uniref:SET domain-containing protein n=1 Tax=Prymnesium parvum TaxID=97485 RepID=A0AB34IFK0_PRYPA